MRPSRGMGFLVLTLVGVSGCAGMPQRGATTSSPMEAPAAVAPARPSGWRGWWSRWRAPAAKSGRVPAATFDPDLPVETSGRAVPETNIWPDHSHGPFSRLLPTLGQNQPTPPMTAAQANEAIARLARPRKTDDQRVLPVGLWVDADDPDEPKATARPAFDGAPRVANRPEPIPASGLLLERLSTQPRPKLDPDARSVSTTEAERDAEVDPAEAVAPPPLATLAQAPPPPPLRPSPRVEPAPPPAVEDTPPAAPGVASPETAEPAEPARPSEPSEPQEHTPEPPSSSLPAAAAPEASAPTVPGATSVAAVPTPTPAPPAGAGWASGQTLVAMRPSEAPAQRWSLLKWFRPQPQAEPRHLHHPGVFPSPQGPVELPPALVPTSYHSNPTPTPIAQQACVTPSAQCAAPTGPAKKSCVVVTRLQKRWEQYRQWKHEHVCKHIQGLKDLLAGKNRCEACGGTGFAPTPSPQGFPSAQAPAPSPQAQAQAPSWSPFHRIF